MRYRHGSRPRVASILVLIVVLGAHSARAQIDLGGPGFLDGQVRAVTTYQGILVLGGELEAPTGENRPWRSIVGWDAGTWRHLGEVPYGRVECLTVFNGDLIVGGWLQVIEGVAVQHVARFDGVTWHAMGTEVPMGASALGSYAGELYAGAPSARRTSPLDDLLWRWDGAQWQGIALPPSIAWGAVHALLEHDGKLWVAGCFLPDGASAHAGLGVLCWDGLQWSVPGDGLRSSAENPDPYRPRGVQGVHALARLGEAVVAAGSMCDPSRGIAGLAAWDGSAWSGLPSRGVASDVVALDTMVIPVGSLVHTMADATEQMVLAGWDGNTWHPLQDERFGTTPGAHGIIAGTVLDGALVLVGGARYDGPEGWYGEYKSRAVGRALLLWDGHTWSAPLSGGGAMGTVWSLVRWQDRLLVGGEFYGVGHLPFSYVTSWDRVRWTPMGQGLAEVPACPRPYDVDTQTGVLRLLPVDDDLYAVGHFALEASGLAQQNIARWDGQRWEALGSGLSRTCDSTPSMRMAWVHSAVRYGNDLVVAGFFDHAGGVEVNGLASWDGVQWSADPPGPQPIPSDDLDTGWINSLAVHDGALLACWSIGTYIDGGSGFKRSIPRARRWTGTQWEELLPGGPNVSWIKSVHGETLLGTDDPVTHVVRIQRLIGDQLAEYPYPGAALDARAVKESPSGVYLIGSKLWHWNGQRLEVVQEDWHLMPGVIEQYDGKLWIGSDYGAAGQWGLSYLTLPASVPAVMLQLSAILVAGGVELRWSTSPAPDSGALEDLRLERRAGQGGPWTIVAGPQVLGAQPEGRYQDAPAEGRAFVYRAAARVDGVHVTSAEVLAMLPPSGCSRLLGIQPNPFNPATTLHLRLASAGKARIEIYAANGRLVKTLELGGLPAGLHAVPWDGRDDAGRAVASGVYTVRLRAADAEDTLRAVLVK